MDLSPSHKSEPDWAALVRAHRLFLRLSVREYAALWGVHRQTAYQWEWGRSKPPLEAAWKAWSDLEAAKGTDGNA